MTPVRLAVLEYILVGMQCAAIGALIAWGTGNETVGQVAVGGLVGSLAAVAIALTASVRVLPDSLAVAMLCFLLWLVFVLPLVILPFAACWWLRSSQDADLKG